MDRVKLEPLQQEMYLMALAMNALAEAFRKATILMASDELAATQYLLSARENTLKILGDSRATG